MGLKKENYEVKELGITLPMAYAVVRKLDRYGDSGYAELWIHNSRDNAKEKQFLERYSVSFKLTDGVNPYTAAYQEAVKPRTTIEMYYVNPETDEEVEEGTEGAKAKTREVPAPAILDGWQNDIV